MIHVGTTPTIAPVRRQSVAFSGEGLKFHALLRVRPCYRFTAIIAYDTTPAWPDLSGWLDPAKRPQPKPALEPELTPKTRALENRKQGLTP